MNIKHMSGYTSRTIYCECQNIDLVAAMMNKINLAELGYS